MSVTLDSDSLDVKQLEVRVEGLRTRLQELSQPQEQSTLFGHMTAYSQCGVAGDLDFWCWSGPELKESGDRIGYPREFVDLPERFLVTISPDGPSPDAAPFQSFSLPPES
jgi:hypothetical protein